MEELYEIKGYEGLYSITKSGKVWSHKRGGSGCAKTGRFIVCFENNGYIRVYLCKSGKNRVVNIHRLLCETFIPNPENKPEVNHINGNKLDNRLENLEWVTSSENRVHAFRTGLKNNNHLRKLTMEQVKEIRQVYSNKNIFQRELAKKYNVSQVTIGGVVRGRFYKE